jgi:hypothetical protein
MRQSFLDIGDRCGDVQSAIDFLRDSGYSVVKNIPIDEVNIKKIPDLIEFFYTTLQFYNPDRIIHYTKNINTDNKMASSFVKSRMLTGISRDRAFL